MNDFLSEFPDWTKCLTAIITFFTAAVSLYKSIKSESEINKIKKRLYDSDKISFFIKVSEDGKKATNILYDIKNEETVNHDFKQINEFTSFICANLSYFPKSHEIETKKEGFTKDRDIIKNDAENIRWYCNTNKIDKAVKLIDGIVCEANAYIQLHKINNVVN